MTAKTPLESLSTGVKSAKQIKKRFSILDFFKLLIALAVFGVGLWAYYSNVLTIPSYAKQGALAVSGLIALVLILFWCQFGRAFLEYVSDSYNEFKKVVWLTRAESIKITVRVIIFVAILSAFIYGVDSLISIVFNTVLLKG
ncbi:MAG: preprotein translocase subunit SecE [Neisseria sp.]|uniref:preprotein translocase subunit SecE n=1 Tax=Neisseria sp. TaxID=192066 RepID=UPI0026DC44E8|nr:preprotein translocase subunit SecE [Neisseria sp.]MDO4641407.1 preprotein translocase subunit SecE [Neisseria sp.]